MQKYLIPALASLALLVACGDATTTDEPSTPGRSDASPSSGQSPNLAPDGTIPIDTAAGTITVTATGVGGDTWTFRDANGSISEQAGGGQTSTILQLEGHNEPQHIRFRLQSASGDVTPGRYTIGATDRGLDAAFENGAAKYRSLGAGAKGSVELTSISADRAVGAFDVTLETISEPTSTTTIKGNFDMRVQR